MLILIVAGGPDKGRIYELNEDQPVILGREGDQIRLNDRKCSRKHAKIWAEGGKWYVRDLNSRHGTHVNATQVENRHELQDGDHVQIGSTLFVLARLVAEHAERTALLGDPASMNTGTAPLAKLVRPRVLAGGAAAAAALILGSNAALYLASKHQNDRLYSEVQSARTQTQRTEKLLEEVRGSGAMAAGNETLQEILAAVQAQKQQETLLAQIADAVKSQPEQVAILRDVVAKLDAQPQTHAKTQEMLATVLERVESQPQVDLTPLVAEVKAVADAARQQQQTLVARADRHETLLRDSLAQFQEAAAADPELAATLERAVASNAGNAEMLQQILANLDQQKALAAEIGGLRAALEAEPRATQAVVREIIESLPPNNDAAVLAAVQEIRRSLPQNVGEKLDDLLARLDQPQGTTDQLAAALKAALDERAVVGSEALDQLATRLEAQPTRDDLHGAVAAAAAKPADRVLARLDELAKAQPTAEQLLAALRAADQEPDPTLVAKLDDIQQQLEASRAAAAAGGDDELAAALASNTRATQQLISDVLAEVRNREPLDALRSEVRKLAESRGGNPEEALAQVLAAVKERGPSDADARLAEMHELIRAWPEHTESMLKEMVAAIAESRDPEAEAIQGVLGDIKRRALARIDELDHAIRSDIRSGLTQELDAAAAPAVPAASRGRATRSAVLHDAQENAVNPATGLSKTEEAYQAAFETGKPIRIGAGVINASTGEVSEGRTLDPGAAKAAGMKTWREWYNYDQLAEQMRLQKQALRYRGDNPRTDVITLPPNRATRIEQATPDRDTVQDDG